MANQVTQSGSMSYADGLTSLASPTVAMGSPQGVTTGQTVECVKLLVLSASDTAIPLPGTTAALAYYLLVNRDPTNTVDVKAATGGAIIARLQPNGGFMMGQWGASGVTAPYARANTANCEVDVYIFGP